MKIPFRTGFGLDVHQFSDNRKLIIGGVEIPHSKGLAGHSDADVLLHAVADALLGSLSLGDIGKHFPDTDDKYKNADSKLLLKIVYELIKNKGYKIGNADVMLTLENPKIAKYIPQMVKIISEILECEESQISIKATTSEKMGFVGREEGAVAFATVLVLAE